MPARKQQTKTKQNAKSGMAAKSRSSKVKTLEPRKGVSNGRIGLGFKITLIVIASFVAIFFAIEGIAWYKSGQEAVQYQKMLEGYLDKKYDQKFVVEKPVHENYGFAVEGDWRAIAWPEGKPAIKFTVKTAYTRQTSSTYNEDTYPDALWNKQATEYIAPLMTSVFGAGVNYKVEIISYGQSINGVLPSSFKQALAVKQYEHGYALSIDAKSVVSFKQLGATIVAQQIHDAATKLLEAGVTGFLLQYSDGGNGHISYDYPFGKTSIASSEELIDLVRGAK